MQKKAWVWDLDDELVEEGEHAGCVVEAADLLRGDDVERVRVVVHHLLNPCTTALSLSALSLLSGRSWKTI